MSFSPLASSADDDLLALARLAAAELAPVAGGALLRVHETSPGTEALAWRPLRGEHPLDLLLGYVAPPTWRAIGVCTTGRAHRRRGSDRVIVTLLVDRSGAAASLLHHGDGDDEVLPGRPEGVVPDACRRALGLPTTPPPRSSLGLWTASWLDRVVAIAAAREPGQPALSWGSVARLHPAGTGSTDPVALALAAAALAEAWPWHRLRAEPSVTDLPGRLPPADVARWMDDGMWARWVADALPPVDDLLSATRALLSPVIADAIELVVGAAADAGAWSPGGTSEDDAR